MKIIFRKVLKFFGSLVVLYVFLALLNVILLKPGYLLVAIYYDSYDYEPRDLLFFPLPMRDKISHQLLKFKGLDALDNHLKRIFPEDDYKTSLSLFISMLAQETGNSMKLNDQFEVADSMIAMGLDPNRIDHNNCTALQNIFILESHRPDHPELLQKVTYLLSRGATWEGYGAQVAPEGKGFYCTQNSMNRFIKENPKAWQLVQDSERRLSYLER